MVRIKIVDLPEKEKISREEMMRVIGGTFVIRGPLFISRFPFDIQGSLRGATTPYKSSLEGAGYQGEMEGLHASQHDEIKEKWSSDD